MWGSQLAVLSRGYTESVWCLEELASIAEMPEKAIPVFFNVPTGFRVTPEVAAKLLKKTLPGGEHVGQDDVQRWNIALALVSKKTGVEKKHL